MTDQLTTVDGPADAPVLVLSNSLGTTRHLWHRQLPELSRHFRVIRYDLPGHDGSAAAAGPYTVDDLGRNLLALLDKLGIERAHLAGVSLGGMLSMWVASHAPERVDRLALICTSAYLPPAQGWHDRAAAVRANGTGPLVEASLGRWFTPAFHQRDPELMKRIGIELSNVDSAGYAGCCEAIAAMDQRDSLPLITAPTLVIAGADDPAAPPEHGQDIAARIPGANLWVLDQASHLAVLEQAETITRLLIEHLAGPTHPHLRGMITRRAVLGDAHVDRTVAATTDFTADFQDFLTRYAWGEVWNRPGLDRKTRSCVTLAVLTALHCDNEIAMHVRGAIHNGLTKAEIAEVLHHTAIYAGLPAANAAFAIAKKTLEEMDD
ncbi:bifunctional 3-oxoadipate enol-lactonase/4-carboxymuconolactone decarboxylase PcaDC [Fodinicola feengrottensis]|uniref:3-oxoadipate enol-lactonase n=1 Tax=Fodinicola feengrottensis TaxID=435914 RepID=A0ABP4SPC2_9ACTN|nr:3-oxoadipate enol-lactonase [Fodinicola feengrottensis]